ncbi:MAG: double-strand break repair helicase AddA [Pseudomonadota bacterium]
MGGHVLTSADIADDAIGELSKAIQEQKRAANPERSAWVEANAGSGKTKVLIDRVARLLLSKPDGRPGAAPDSILCVTYTKAAANEMLSRLFKTLGDWSISSDEALRKNLSQLEERSASDYSPTELRQARTLFARALETPGGLRIETIHAFCARVLRRFPLEAGIAPGFTEIEDKEADELWQSVLNDQIETAAKTHPEAIITLSRAAGGRGIKAALNMLRFQREALLEFQRKLSEAEASLGDSVRQALKAPALSAQAHIEVVMSDAFPQSQLETLADRLVEHPKAKDKDAKLAEAIRFACSDAPARERWDAWLSVFQTASGTWIKSNPYSACHKDDTEVSDLFQVKDAEGSEVTRIKAAYTTLLSIEAAERSEALLTIGLPIVEAYQREKRHRAALDFDDLIEQTRRLLTVSDAADWVLYKLDGGLTHLLLDEAQDTSPRQWELINALVEEFQSGLGSERLSDPRTQFVVGDPKQSIYSFQGANQEQFERERRRFIAREEVLSGSGGGAETPQMLMSFRSSPEILSFVDTVREFAPLPDATTDALPPPDADISQHIPRRSNQPGRVEVWPLISKSETETDHADEDYVWQPVDYTPESAALRQLAEQIAKTVRDAIDQGESVWREDRATKQWGRSALKPEDILILVRKRGPLFNAIIDSLKRQDLPVAGADRLALLDVLGVQDCLNLMRFTLQPGDDLVLAEILRGPFCNLVDDDHHLYSLAHKRRDETLWDRLAKTTDPVFAEAKAFCEALLDNRSEGAHAFLNRVLHQPVGDAHLTGFERLVQRLGEPVRDPVRALLMKALRHDMAAPKSLQRFLNEIEADDTELKRDLGEPDRAIRIMTVHGAKGLQAPFVILPDTTAATKLNDSPLFVTAKGVPVHSGNKRTDNSVIAELRALRDAAAERESRRLLYVALTRAQDRLLICGAEDGRNKKTGFAKSSWYRWCQIAMCELTGITAPEDGDRLTDTLVTGPAPIKTGKENTDAEHAVEGPDWIWRRAPQLEAESPAISPSRLDPSAVVSMNPFGQERRARLRRGRLIHDLLQRLPILAPDRRRDTAQALLDRETDLSDEARREIVDVSLRALDNSEFSEVFSHDGRSEVPVTGRLPNGQLINGRVDRLIVQKGRVLIIDYKTDQPAPNHESAVGTAYLRQMAAYQLILSAIYPDHEIKCALLYTDGPNLISLSSDHLSESLKGLNIGV